MRTRALWPWMVAATVLVMVLPAAAVWALSVAGILTTLWAAVAVSAVLSLVATSAGSAYWRRHTTGDVLFSDLPLWGWMRRRRMQHRLARADQLLAAAAVAPPERTAALLAELGAALDAEDPYLDGHSRRIARYATMTARRMHLPEEQVQRIKTAAAVHDIGKLRVPDAIVHKPGRLTSDEYEQIKRHAVEGAALIERLGDPALTAAVRAHHERFDGNGYPDGLAGERIPLEARIISVADTFDSITSARAYRPPTSQAKALEVVASEAGRQFDPDATRAFISCYSGRRAGALWASLAALPRQLASRLSISPGELTAAAATALSVSVVVLACGAAAAALPDTAADPSAVALSQPPATPPGDPTPGDTAAANETAGEPAGKGTPAATPQGAAIAGTPAAGAAPGSPTPATTPGTASQTPTATPAPSPTPGRSGTPSATVTPAPAPAFNPLAPPPFPAATPKPPQPTATPAPPDPTPAPTAGPPDPAPTSSPPFPTPTATPRPPHTAEDCRNGGWKQLGYPNQGECIADAT